MFLGKFFGEKGCFVLLVLAIVLVPYVLMAFSPPKIFFNQHYIEKLDSSSGAAVLGEKARSFISYNSHVWNQAFNQKGSSGLNINDSREVFDYVFSQIPYYSIVYPTEMYYYYWFETGGTNISGNLRLVELINGSLTIGYFDKDNKGVMGAGKIGKKEGLDVDKISDNLFKVSYGGKTVYFRLNDIWDDSPDFLLESEDFVAKVRDESGIIFYLVFDKETKAFYYILDENRRVTEKLDPYGRNLLIGNRTGFAYYHDEENGRKILFGVDALNIGLNDYFDGPFDQVPPRLDILDKIHEGYPYTKAVMLDKYGNFLFSDSMRMAITPYTKYYLIEELSAQISSCEENSSNKAEFYACISWEKKRDFHKDSDLFYENGTLKNSSIYSN